MDSQSLLVAEHVVVSMDYRLVVDGAVIDSTENAAPLQYIQGCGNIIPGLECQLLGMARGDSREVLVPARDAYGEHNPEAYAEIPRSQFPADFAVEVGGSIRVRDDSGRVHTTTICEISDENVKLNFNHPLAGKDLLFKATIVDLRPATPEEIANGRLGGGCSCSSGSCSSGSCSSGSCG